ncbi:MAG: hypothetical protein AAFR79_07540 [Pseudomonadota bacterium]
MTKPKGWPRYMVEKQLAGGGVAYYWSPPTIDRKKGCKIEARALGSDYANARSASDDLNDSLDAWRNGAGGVKVPRSFGSVRWWLHTYKTKTIAFKKLSDRTKKDYERHTKYVEELALEKKTAALKTFGDLPLSAISPRAVDKLYERLMERVEVKDGQEVRVERKRQAEYEIAVLKKAWDAVQRQFPEIFPSGNPFKGLEMERRQKETTQPATVEETYALAKALSEIGHPHLGAAALICFEWLQRPENVLAGAVTWSGYRAGMSVRIDHWKTHVTVDHDLSADDELLYPELEAYLAGLDRVGLPIVLWGGAPGAPRPYKFRHAHSVVARARKHAGLPDHVTLAACRHGGLTELGDAQVTEAEGMALSAHRDPKAFRVYVKRTQAQRISASRKRRAWREESGS